MTHLTYEEIAFDIFGFWPTAYTARCAELKADGIPTEIEIMNPAATGKDPVWTEFESSVKEVIDLWAAFGALPDPKAIQEEAGILEEVVGLLTSGPNSDGGAMGVHYGKIRDHANAMEGTTIEIFKSGIVTALPKIVDNLCAASLIAKVAVLAEKTCFEKARIQFAEAFNGMYTALEKRIKNAESSSSAASSIALALNIVSTVATVAATAITAGGAAPAALAIVGGTADVGALIASRQDAQDKYLAQCASVEEIGRAFISAVKAINNDLYKIEEEIKKGLERAFERISAPSDPDSFELIFRPLESVSDITKFEGARVNVISEEMQKIVESIDNASQKLGECNLGSVIKRSSEVGLGPSGPTGAFEDFLQEIKNRLTFLAQDVENAKHNLDAAYQELVSQDGAVAESLQQTADSVRITDAYQAISRFMGNKI